MPLTPTANRLGSFLSNLPSAFQISSAVITIISVYYLTRRYASCSKCASSHHGKCDGKERVGKEEAFKDDNSEEYKMVILIRNDLGMSKGKAVAQACHATLAAYKSALRQCPSVVKMWDSQGQPKVALRVDSEADLVTLIRRARTSNLVGGVDQGCGEDTIGGGDKDSWGHWTWEEGGDGCSDGTSQAILTISPDDMIIK